MQSCILFLERNEKNGKHAVTHYKVIERFGDYTWIACRLETGRTHQIRVHMAYLGHPLYGDQLYGVKDSFSRQALNCFYLSFPDPVNSEKDKTVEISDPSDMQNLWQKLINKKF